MKILTENRRKTIEKLREKIKLNLKKFNKFFIFIFREILSEFCHFSLFLKTIYSAAPIIESIKFLTIIESINF